MLWRSHLLGVASERAVPFIGRSHLVGGPKETIRRRLFEGDYPRRLFEGDYSKEWRTRYFWSGAHDIFWSGALDILW